MEAILIYLLKSAGLISIFYIAYLVLLKNDTSFSLNRKFLLGGIITSAILPSFYFTKKVFVKAPVEIFYDYDTLISEAPVVIERSIQWWQIAGGIYLVVTGFFVLRFFLQLFRILYLVNTNSYYTEGKFRLIETSGESGPFSFFNYIVFNPALHTAKELYLIITHEKIHARQWHTLDILIGNLNSCLLWFNPFSWFYKKSMAQNLEYIADRDTVAASDSKKEYLKTLVKVSCGNLQPALSNSFYQSFIKKRIIMINKKTHPTNNAWKISVVLPAILAFMLAFNVQTELVAQEQPTKITTSEVEIMLDIDKNTTQEVLDRYVATMNEYDVILKFEDVKYNSEGLLTHIKVEFIDRSNVSSGNVTKSNEDGISPFRYVYHSKEGSRFTTPKSHAPTSSTAGTKNIDVRVVTAASQDTAKILIRGKSGTGAQPVYVVNGKVIKSEDMDLDPSNVNNIQVLKGAAAVSVLGKDNKDGVIVITTNKHQDSINKSFVVRREVMYDKDNNIEPGKKSEIRAVRFNDSIIKNSGKLYITGGDINASQYGTNQNTFLIRNFNEERSPLYIIDGKEIGEDDDVKKLDPNNISSIQVFKDKTATLKYGEKAKYGAIEITTKNQNSKATSSVNLAVISANSSNDQLIQTKNQLKEQAKLDITYQNIERNRRGRITGITISAKYKDKTSSATFQVDKGIPDVYLGVRNGDPIISSNPPAKK